MFTQNSNKVVFLGHPLGGRSTFIPELLASYKIKTNTIPPAVTQYAGDDIKKHRINFFDVSGQPIYKAIRQFYYKNASLYILVFNYLQPETHTEIELGHRIKEIVDINPHFEHLVRYPVILLGLNYSNTPTYLETSKELQKQASTLKCAGFCEMPISAQKNNYESLIDAMLDILAANAQSKTLEFTVHKTDTAQSTLDQLPEMKRSPSPNLSATSPNDYNQSLFFLKNVANIHSDSPACNPLANLIKTPPAGARPYSPTQLPKPIHSPSLSPILKSRSGSPQEMGSFPPAVVSARPIAKNINLCCSCSRAPRRFAFVGCGHYGACEHCIQHMVQVATCPACSEPILGILEIKDI